MSAAARGNALTRDKGLPFGVNLVGHFRAELGVGEVGRLILAALSETRIPYTARAYSAFLSRQNHPFKTVGQPFRFDTNLLCVNADQLPPLAAEVGMEALEGRYNIGVWWWEVDVLPAHMAKAADLLDEIWVGTEHVGRAVVAATHKLVRLLPIPIIPIEPHPVERESLGLPMSFMFLFTFDFLSIFDRKNPVAVVEAFKRAFGPGEGPFLLIKSINGDGHVEQLNVLRAAVAGRPDIEIRDGYLSKEQQEALIASCDCYVSLHRAEGYGLGMAEAASLAKPIIATGYSGNLSFLNRSNSLLVGYRLVSVPPAAGPYPQEARWAEPDVDEAAHLMRKVYSDREEASALGEKAREDCLRLHTIQRTTRFLHERLEAIRYSRVVDPAAATLPDS